MITQGQAVNSEQEEFTAFLINILEPTSQQDFENKIASMSEDELKELYRQFKQAKNQKLTRMAKDGLKFDFLEKYRGKCPDGTEMFMSGGCVKCRDKKNKMTIKNQDGGNIKERFKKGPGDSDSVDNAKPNKKQVKAFKDCNGGKARKNCNGSKMRKRFQEGGGFRILEPTPVPKVTFQDVLKKVTTDKYVDEYGRNVTSRNVLFTDKQDPKNQAVLRSPQPSTWGDELLSGYDGKFKLIHPYNSEFPKNEEALKNEARRTANPPRFQEGGEPKVGYTPRTNNRVFFSPEKLNDIMPTSNKPGIIYREYEDLGPNLYSRAFELPPIPNVETTPEFQQAMNTNVEAPLTTYKNTDIDISNPLEVSSQEVQTEVQEPAQKLSFAQAFANARKSGLSTFDWNGGSYNTKLAEEQPTSANNTETEVTTSTTPAVQSLIERMSPVGVTVRTNNRILPAVYGGERPQLAKSSNPNDNKMKKIDKATNRFENRQERQKNRLTRKTNRIRSRFS